MKKKKSKLKTRIYHLLLLVTNNLPNSTHEREYDIFFFLFNTTVIIIGCVGLYIKGEWPWIALFLNGWAWSLDTLRNNRTYIK